MKYLGLHKLLWLVLVLAYTMIDVFFWLLGIIAYIVWYLKFPAEDSWNSWHRCDNPYRNRWDGSTYSDRNIFDTIRRRFLMFKTRE